MLKSAQNHRQMSALVARRAVRESRKVRGRGVSAMAAVVAAHQATQAHLAQAAIADMLAEQNIREAAEARLNPAAFTTDARGFGAMAGAVQERAEPEQEQARLDMLVESLVQDAARVAAGVAIAVHANIGWVRVLNSPTCSRCAVLAGRVYTYSDGFLRHPRDDCSTAAVRTGDSTLASDPAALARSGLVTGAPVDTVDTASRSAGLQESGRAVTRPGRPTPAGIYAATADRGQHLALLADAGYIR